MPQSAEHLDALHALGVQHALLAITRTDRADPAAASQQAQAELARTSLGDVETVAVSAPSGVGLDALRSALDRLLAQLPDPDLDAPVRLWIDRSFSIRGSGTVVTGTLAAGRLRVGDELELTTGRPPARVRSLQCLGQPVQEATAVARVAVNLRGVESDELRRGDALLTPRSFLASNVIDVRINGDDTRSLPRQAALHLGSAAVSARVRPLGPTTARLTLARPLPLRIGDRGLLRDPGRHHVSGGVTILDVDPPALTRRGAAATRAKVLARLDGRPDEPSELRRRGIVQRERLVRMGVPVTAEPAAGDWLVDDTVWADLRTSLAGVVAGWQREHPLEPGPPIDVVRQLLGLPHRALVRALVRRPLTTVDGRVVNTAATSATLPPAVAEAIEKIRADLKAAPFAAPDAGRLADLGLGPRELAAAERAGALIRIADGVVLLPESVDHAMGVLRSLPQPFTVSEARKALGTSRRVAIPLLQYLDQRDLTDRQPDDRRTISSAVQN